MKNQFRIRGIKMKNILLVTNNVVNDNTLLLNFQLAGFEVFGTRNFFLLNKTKLLNLCAYFDAVVFSTSITNADAIKGKRSLTALGDSISYIRVVIDKEQIQNKELNDFTYISMNESLDEVRETLDESTSRAVPNKSSDILISKAIEDFRLTKNEIILFSYLEDADGEFITREKLCSLIWKGECTPSQLSQLSTLMTRIKNKIEAIGINPSKLLITKNKFGYKLNLFSTEYKELKKFSI
jgi:DNA-binding winged helix-turn-helix (wHTH) protein